MEEKLKEYGLTVCWNEAEDREPIDFEIADDTDNVCWVWGSEPFNDVQIECDHPEEAIDYEFDPEHHQGRCEICGAWCDVSRTVEEEWEHDGTASYSNVYEIIDWHTPNRIGGIVGDYIQELREKW